MRQISQVFTSSSSSACRLLLLDVDIFLYSPFLSVLCCCIQFYHAVFLMPTLHLTCGLPELLLSCDMVSTSPFLAGDVPDDVSNSHPSADLLISYFVPQDYPQYCQFNCSLPYPATVYVVPCKRLHNVEHIFFT